MNGQRGVIELNVGGNHFSTTKEVLTRDPNSKLSMWFGAGADQCPLPRDAAGRFFIDRDGTLFRFLLDSLRACDGGANDAQAGATKPAIALPDGFNEWTRLRHELDFYALGQLAGRLVPRSRTPTTGRRSARFEEASAGDAGYITVGYHGTFSFGHRQGVSQDVNFRKVSRILICGRVSMCREVFGDSLNEGRDPDRGEAEDRYTARFFLKHNFLEQAFDALTGAGFRLVTSCGTGTSGPSDAGSKTVNTEEDRWAHYNEFIFCRP